MLTEHQITTLTQNYPEKAADYILELQQRLGVNSSNSGLSPSADPFKKKLK